MNIIWKEWDVTPEVWSLGHGMPFLDRRRGSDNRLVAFVDGFYWLNDKTADQVIYCIKPDALTSPKALEAIKSKIVGHLHLHLCMHPGKFLEGMITRNLRAVVNG